MMISLRSFVILFATLRVAFAAQSLTFLPPSSSPTQPSPNYVGKSNFTLPRSKLRSGIVFDRFVTVVMENTNFDAAATTDAFQKLSQMGITYTNYHGLYHPSEPNYVPMAGGDTFGLESDDMVYIPANVSTIVDLLEEKGISWASYQENMPCNGYNGKTYSSPNYLNGNNGTNTFYQRKHHQLADYNSTNQNPRRASNLRNLNDFANDIGADSLPGFIFVTPNIDNDAHDTGIEPFGSDWLEYWLLPLLKDERFNGEKTVVFVTFDENDMGPGNNQVYTVAVGNGIPKHLRGTKDNTYYNHYTVLSTTQLNWGLNCLGRQDTNKTMNNVLGFVADQAGYKNTVVLNPPLTNTSVRATGPLNTFPEFQTPWEAPNLKAKCVNPHGHVFFNPNPPINKHLFDNGNCPQVAFSSDASLQWSTRLDEQIIAEQLKFQAPAFLIDPSKL